MKVVNKHSATLTVGVGRVRIAPGTEADLSVEDLKVAGVRSWLESGKLAEVKAKKADDK